MNPLIVREGARRVDTTEQDDKSPLYSPEVVMSWPELGMTLLVTAITAVFVVWFCTENWPHFVAALGAV